MTTELTVNQQLTAILIKFDPTLPRELLDNLPKDDKLCLLKELVTKNAELNLLAKKASLDIQFSEEAIKAFYRVMQNELPQGTSIGSYLRGSEATGELTTGGVGYSMKIKINRRY